MSQISVIDEAQGEYKNPIIKNFSTQYLTIFSCKKFVTSEVPFKAMRFVFACLLVLALMSVACEAVPANNKQQSQNKQHQQQSHQKNNSTGAQNAKNGQGNQNGP
ncbi:hypothetical protein TNIN_390011 [Trichonephila inaurata madagascariensis]|uniref:Uncharacterized protein n=1 Tax=Trichonephila inaurata madagascariensis TaxID=2747483 RepID=A0A8X6X0C7_9ARAC|nr:hypothetical protein TNIN_390011 [Trichonephila inaurata madagascariensis]